MASWRGHPHRTKMSSRLSFFEVEIRDLETRQHLCFLDKVEPNLTIGDVKQMFHACYPKWYPARQSMQLEPGGRALKDEEILKDLPTGTTAILYFKDLGSHLGYTTIFLAEYSGPLLVYFLFYLRLPVFYGTTNTLTSSPHSVIHLACCCHTFHYIKKAIEVLFVHRFTHGTMPLRNMIKNSYYYLGFTAWFAYYINHPLYTPPSFGKIQIALSLILFLICETGNFSVHVALNSMKADVPKAQRFPQATRNPFTWLYVFVSCPNYTYEMGSLISFAIMTQCIPAGVYAFIRFFQLTIWAREKHHKYLKDFKEYPRFRTSIIPLIL
ncbi:very-long-chain enoyl-CoA reductase-like isoform X2 [Pelobates fuscus]|uniref:very-long-chain enoyl-CoA reductase-like isoform X2 n=1 Tax=Pelobates fuscus TaxID=191477 RepID=UPI002FE42D54